MGTVYRAQQINLGRPVVIKTLHPHLAKNEDLIKRFQREAKSAATLQHPNTVQVIEYGQEGDLYFIAMEYVDGLDLKELLTEMGAFPSEVALLVLRDVCRGMEAAHARGIIHRDIKPANLMITTRGQVKVMDFGLAREAVDSTELTAHGSIMGTAAYMPPEQARGETDRLDHRADIFSAGLVGYEIAAGRRAFPGQTQVAVFAAVLDGKIDPLDSIVTGLPTGYAELIHWMAHRDLEERCPTMTAARDRLEEMVEAAGVRRAERWLGDFVHEARDRRGVPDNSSPDATVTPAEATASDEESGTPPTSPGRVDSIVETVLASSPAGPSNPAAESAEPGSPAPPSETPSPAVGPTPELAPASPASAARTTPTETKAKGSFNRWAVLVPVAVLALAVGIWQSGIFGNSDENPEGLSTQADPSGAETDLGAGNESDGENREFDAAEQDADPGRPDRDESDSEQGDALPDGNGLDSAVNPDGEGEGESSPDSDPVPVLLTRVTNLEATGKTPSSITLSWTIPATDPEPGSPIATETKVGISQSQIDGTNWAGAGLVAGLPTPTPNQPQTHVVQGLKEETRYFLALRTADANGTLSPVSNLVEVITEATPETIVPIRSYTKRFSVSSNPWAELSLNGGAFDENRRGNVSMTLKEGKNTIRAKNEGMNIDRTFVYQLRKNDPNNKIVLHLNSGEIEKRIQ